MTMTPQTASALPTLEKAVRDAKWAFTTRRVRRADAVSLGTDLGAAVSGDLVLARIAEIGHNKRIQLAQGRASALYRDDLIVATCADRYAPDQFEALAELDRRGADLVAAGGVIGRLRVAHAAVATPTRVEPLGLLRDAAGKTVNIDRYALPTARTMPSGLTVIGVVGASMNAGKTTAAASLAHGLTRAGYRVAGLKITGTGAYNDYHALRDAGLTIVADFTDAGMASTYRQPLHRIETGFATLTAYAAAAGAHIVVAELADGLYQRETAALLARDSFRRHFGGLLFAAADALSAVGGVAHLRRYGLPPLAVSGRVSSSPLAAAEAETAAGVRVLSRIELSDPACARPLIAALAPPPPERDLIAAA